MGLLADTRQQYLINCWEYNRYFWDEFNYSILENCIVKKSHKKAIKTYNDITIMVDTETSKPPADDYDEYFKDNHIVIWTLSIRLLDVNICTLYGRKPSDMIKCINRIVKTLKGDRTIFYWHNMSYDYVFCRKFCFAAWGHPVNMLNVKSHYPINIDFENGVCFRDSLILAQRSLEKWAEDMKVEHQKAIGSWNYDLTRHQNTELSASEMHYAEFDTLAGVECIDALKNQLHKDIGTMPFTSTGILRELVQKEGAKNGAREWFLKSCPTWQQYQKQVKMYHGGYVHGNRHHLGQIIKNVLGGDFASSYPFQLFKKYPVGKFVALSNKSIEYILKYKDDYAFMFKLIMVNPILKDDEIPMPFLQYSKAETINAVVDNGRILAADYVEIYLNEIDLGIIASQYDYDASICVEVEVALKDYLPRWFTDIVYSLFYDKCTKKKVDPILYVIQKFKLNACYGLCCQRWEKQLILEDYETGEYEIDESVSPEELFTKHVKNRKTILLYSTGVWCTSYAVEALFRMGNMCEWLYSDTDSVYGTNWNMHEVKKYNQECINFMHERGYDTITLDGRDYNLGVIEFDEGSYYRKFKYIGAKRYAGTHRDGSLAITVAGVPKKKGALCLKRDLRKFEKGFTFKGTITGKLTHSHQYIDEIYVNKYGDEVGDSIDLSPCDYEMDVVPYKSIMDWACSSKEITIEIADDSEGVMI